MTVLVSTIRTLLTDVAAQELPQFEAELADAGADTAEVLARWAGRAALLANPLTPEEKEQLERFRRTGDGSGFLERTDDGRWVRL